MAWAIATLPEILPAATGNNAGPLHGPNILNKSLVGGGLVCALALVAFAAILSQALTGGGLA